MTDPSNPNYQIATSMPVPGVPPDHPFNRTELDFCDHVVLVLESGYPVVCGLKRNQHPHDNPPTPRWQKWADE